MERAFGQLTDREILAIIGHGLDALFDDRLRLPSDAEQLGLLQEAVRLGGRLQVWTERLAGRIERSEAAWTERKTSTATWLAESMNLTTREAKRLIKAGQELERFGWLVPPRRPGLCCRPRRVRSPRCCVTCRASSTRPRSAKAKK